MRLYSLLLCALALGACGTASDDAGMPVIDLSVSLEGAPWPSADLMVIYYPDIGDRDAASLEGPHPIDSFLVKSCTLEEGQCMIPTKPAEGAHRADNRKQAIEIFLVNRPEGANGSSRLGYAGWTGQSYPDALEISCDLQVPETGSGLTAAACSLRETPA